MTPQNLPSDVESLKKLSVVELVAIQKHFVEAIGNLDLSDQQTGHCRARLEELDTLISRLTALKFESRTVEFKDALKIKDATARIKESTEQMEKAAKTVGNLESILKIVDQGLKMGAMFFCI